LRGQFDSDIPYQFFPAIVGDDPAMSIKAKGGLATRWC